MCYVIGVDFGTLSARAIVVDTSDGHTLGEGVCAYAHGVMDAALPDGTPLPGSDWALADPQDYWAALSTAVRGAARTSGVAKADIRALAIAATACTLMPVDAFLTPLCALPAFRDHPHAYAKLWKHHRAQPYADRMTEAARQMALPQLADYGGRISSEWAVPKVMEVLAEDEVVYRAADRFMQFSDWLTARLVGDGDVQNGSIAAYKAMASREALPPDAYFDAVGTKAREIIHHKLRGRRIRAGRPAGMLTPEGAQALDLCPGTVIAMAHTDAHAAALGVGAAEPGDYVYILGTSTCGHLLAKETVDVPGVTGRVPNGLVEGCTCYSAGQACAGDMLDWFIRQGVPAALTEEAAARGLSPHQLLERKAAPLPPGGDGLLALDWWNGNRSTLVDAQLSGLVVGLTMDTRPEAIYRALLESIAFGHREILENFRRCGLEARSVVLCGGIVHKNALLMQIMADVLDRPVALSAEAQATALGAAMCAASALGVSGGGWATLPEAIRRMRAPYLRTVTPRPEHRARYAELYALYHQLYHYFGREQAHIMHCLRQG